MLVSSLSVTQVPKPDKLDSKTKAAFTRAYNARAHKSQALVAEQGAGKTVKRKASSIQDTFDPDAIDDDKVQEQDDNDEEEENEAKIKALFAKKKRRGAGTKKASTKASKKTKK